MVFNFEKFRAGQAPKKAEEAKPMVVIVDDDSMNLRVMNQIL